MIGSNPLPQLSITALASAHESLSVDENGQHAWLGYVLDLGGLRIYHSGDCIPYPRLRTRSRIWRRRWR